MKYLALGVLLLFSFVAMAQTDCGPAYQRIINQADNDLKQGLFKLAFEGYRAARGCTKAKLDYIDHQMSAALDSIEQQRLKSVAREELLQKTLKRVEATNAALKRAQGDLEIALAKAKNAENVAKLAEAEARKSAVEKDQALTELRATYKEKIESLLRQAELQISRLNYDSVLLIVNHIHDFPGGKEKTQELLFECAFFYGESGQLEKAREVFVLSGEKINLDRITIANYLKAQNPLQYDTLMKMYYPSFQKINGGYFLSTFLGINEINIKIKTDEISSKLLKTDAISRKLLTPLKGSFSSDVYKPFYKLINSIIVNSSQITNRQFYLFNQTSRFSKTSSIINQAKRFSSAKGSDLNNCRV